MLYKEYVTILLVLGILGIEPAGAVEIGSLNQVNSLDMLNLEDKNQKIANYNIINNSINNVELHKLKSNKLVSNCKNKFKLVLNKVKKHKYHKSLQGHLTKIPGKKKWNSSSFVSNNDNYKNYLIKTPKTCANIFGHENEKILNDKNSMKENKSVLNQTGNGTVANKALNITETSIKGTVLDNTNENKTAFNQTGNGTVVNETNVKGTSLNSTDENKTVSNQTDNSTKTHVLNTIENAGYAFAAIAGCFAVGAAVAPEGVTKTVCVVGAIACGVIAAVCFVAYIFVDWFW